MQSEEPTSSATWGTGRVIEGKSGETIDVPEGAGLFILDCSDCAINAPDKSTSVTIERCTGTSVFLGLVEASVVVKQCEGVEVSLLRCHAITVERSKKVSLTSKCQSAAELEDQHEQPPSPDQQISTSKMKTAADEASAIHLFTICSEEVSICFEGVLEDGGSPVIYRVPKDSPDEEGGAGPRSLSRITFDHAGGEAIGSGGGGGLCTTVKCNQHGTPLEELEVTASGVTWLSDQGVSDAVKGSGMAGPLVEGKGEMPEMPMLALQERDSSVAAETGSVADLLDVAELLEAGEEEQSASSGIGGELLAERKASNVSMQRLASFGSTGVSSTMAEAGSVAGVEDGRVAEILDIVEMFDSTGLSAVEESSGEVEPETSATEEKAGGEPKSSKVLESSG